MACSLPVEWGGKKGKAGKLRNRQFNRREKEEKILTKEYKQIMQNVIANCPAA